MARITSSAPFGSNGIPNLTTSRSSSLIPTGNTGIEQRRASRTIRSNPSSGGRSRLLRPANPSGKMPIASPSLASASHDRIAVPRACESDNGKTARPVVRPTAAKTCREPGTSGPRPAHWNHRSPPVTSHRIPIGDPRRLATASVITAPGQAIQRPRRWKWLAATMSGPEIGTFSISITIGTGRIRRVISRASLART